jgi:hypothetical protein
MTEDVQFSGRFGVLEVPCLTGTVRGCPHAHKASDTSLVFENPTIEHYIQTTSSQHESQQPNLGLERLTKLLATMKISTISSAATLALAIPAALGDFSIYAQSISGNGIGGDTNGWQVYPRTIFAVSCDNALGWVWLKSRDVSGLKPGFRCKGSKSSCTQTGSGDGIKELEINTKWTKTDGFPHLSKVPSRLSDSLLIVPCVRFDTLTLVNSVLRQSRRSSRRS